MTEQSTPALQSKTIWGIVITLVPTFLEVLDVVVNSGVLPPPVSGVIQVIGAGLATYGRIYARTPIKGVL